jgi:hypothetical protein
MSYFTTARFNAQKEFEHHPAPQMPTLDASAEFREQIAGTDADWKRFRRSLDSLAEESGLRKTRKESNHFFKKFDEDGVPSIDENGAAWMDIERDGKSANVGLSASNVLARSSGPALSYEFLLARVGHILSSPARGRETMIEFKEDWARLERAAALNTREKNRMVLANGQTGPSPEK